MRNVLIVVLIVVGALASSCSAVDPSEQQQEAVSGFLSKDSKADETDVNSHGLSYERKLMSIGSELDGDDDKLKTLASLVGKLQNRTKEMAYMLNEVPFEDLIEALRGPKGAQQPDKHEEQHQVRAVLDVCQLVYGRLKEVAPEVNVWGKSLDKRYELTIKWLINYTVCKELVAPHKGVGSQINDRWSLMITFIDSSMATFAQYFKSLAEQVALSRSAMISDKLVTEKVVEFIDNRMRSRWSEKREARLQRFRDFLDRLRKSCEQITHDFEPYLWMVDAGAQLNETDKSLYARQVLALKVARVCERLSSIDFEEPIRQWDSKFSLVEEPIRHRNSKSSLVNSIKKTFACGSCPQTTE